MLNPTYRPVNMITLTIMILLLKNWATKYLMDSMKNTTTETDPRPENDKLKPSGLYISQNLP
jgi:hypothetical protein